jgi:hypothetical protein
LIFSFVQFDMWVYLFHIGLMFFQTINFCNATFGVCYICFKFMLFLLVIKKIFILQHFFHFWIHSKVFNICFNHHWYSCGVHRIQISNIALRNTTFILYWISLVSCIHPYFWGFVINLANFEYNNTLGMKKLKEGVKLEMILRKILLFHSNM